MLVSSVLRPEAGLGTPAKLWDPIWFLIHEGASGLVWFGIGAWIDIRAPRLRNMMLSFLSGRAGYCGCLLFDHASDFAGRLELLCWLVFSVYAIVAGTRWVLARASG